MNKKLIVVAFSLTCLLMIAPAAMADSSCLEAPAATYAVAGFTCNINNILDFSNFVFSPTPSPGPTVNVHPIPPDPGVPGGVGNDLGFNFTSGWNTGNTTDINVAFKVTGIGANLISDILIFFQNVGPFTGGESVQFNEQFCNAAAVCDHITITNPGSFTSHDVLLSSTLLGGPQPSLTITKDVQFIGTGTASLSGFGNAYSYIPEPRGVSLLLGLGLFAGLAIFKRRRATQN